jgi:EAL domain-containing protein (putative c-di-GMP-specific phosphodiesterase class I)
MTTIRQAGHKLVLDDFGTGLSSFTYLKQFPIDGLKIDGSFICNIKDNPVDRVIVEAINEICHKLGIKTVAEFVEDAETLEIVKNIGIDHAQGYVVGRPVPLDMMIEDHTAQKAGLI